MSTVTKLSRPPASSQGAPVPPHEPLYRAKAILEALVVAFDTESIDRVTAPAYALEHAIDLIEIALGKLGAEQGGAA